MNKTLDYIVAGVGKISDLIGGLALIAMLSITVIDITLRYFGRPIVGMFEIVSLLGGLVVAFALPKTSIESAHVAMDIAIGGRRVRLLLGCLTRVAGMGLFFLFAWNLFGMGFMFYESGEKSMTLTLPLYPVVFVIGLCCCAMVLVKFTELLKACRSQETSNE